MAPFTSVANQPDQGLACHQAPATLGQQVRPDASDISAHRQGRLWFHVPSIIREVVEFSFSRRPSHSFCMSCIFVLLSPYHLLLELWFVFFFYFKSVGSVRTQRIWAWKNKALYNSYLSSHPSVQPSTNTNKYKHIRELPTLSTDLSAFYKCFCSGAVLWWYSWCMVPTL